jgi:FlaA1/EpsC-like NDP-sugar epimerase
MNKERIGSVLLYIVCDVLFVELAFLIAMGLWFGGSIPGSRSTSVPPEAWVWWASYMAFAAPIVSVAVFWLFHMYDNLWKYASIDEVLKIFVATTLVFIVLYLYDTFILQPKAIMVLARRLLFLAWMLDTMLFGFSRFGYRALRRLVVYISHVMTSKAGCKRVMIIGAGFSGFQVLQELKAHKIRDRIPVVMLDKDSSKNNTHMKGVRIMSTMDRIDEVADKFKIDEIIIALPHVEVTQIQAIVAQCAKTSCQLKIIPPMSDVSDGAYNHIRDVSISDLLSRDEIKLDNKNITDYLNNRVILITGGGGSIGSELCRQIARLNPKMIVIFDFYENGAYELVTELEARRKDKLSVAVRIGSCADPDRMNEVFAEFKPHVVFHAAAHKHVHFMQESAAEAVKNNIFGTYAAASAAARHGVERFVLLSTDKAVNPPNVYGATKRVSEMIIQSMSENGQTKFMTVRFGNVLGSNGSIIPKWKWQIANGGPVTVTHPDMKRFFMTIPEACALVLQAAGLGKNGKTFVLDMGEPVSISDLAENLIKLSGFRPGADIKIEYTGLRPGEKLHEELMLPEEKEGMQVTANKKIFVAKPVPLAPTFERDLKKLKDAVHHDPKSLNALIKKIEPRYQWEEEDGELDDEGGEAQLLPISDRVPGVV